MTVIGEGTYGCVHKPSLKCNTSKKINYTNKISKLMSKKAADEEIKEYLKINKLDKDNNHYLGMPSKCLIKQNKETVDEIKKCTKSSNFLKNTNNLRLLVMNDGGINLSDIFNNEFINYSIEEKIHISELIIIFMYDIFNNLLFFNKKELYHRDIKLENIVFNINEKKINIIDFGLMNSMDDILRDASNDKYQLDVVWWSLAPYSLFINKYGYDKAIKLQSSYNWFSRFKENNKLINGDQIKYFFKRITKNNSLDITILRQDLFKQLYECMVSLKNTSHKKFVSNAIPLLDVHNLGMVLFELVGYTKPYINDPELMNNLIILAKRMINFNVSTHITLKEAFSEYKNILLTSSLLKKNKYFIKNNKITKIKMNDYTLKKKEDYPVDMIFEMDLIRKNIKNKTIKQISSKNDKIFNVFQNNFFKNITKKNTQPRISPVKTRISPIKNTRQTYKNKKTVRFESPKNKTRKTKTYTDNVTKSVKNINPPVLNQSQIKRTNASYNLPIGHYINPKTGNLNKLPTGKMISKVTGNLINIPAGKNINLKTGDLYDLSPGKKVGKSGKVLMLKDNEYLNPKTGRINKLKPGTTYNKTIKKVVSICGPEEQYNKKSKRCESIYGTRPLSSSLRFK